MCVPPPPPLSFLCSNKKKHRYAMKYLAPGIGENRIDPAGGGRNKQFERGVADLAIEARFLALLSHENIIGLHYVSGGDSLGAQYNAEGGDNDDDGDDDDGDDDHHYRHQFGAFLLLDPLHESLARRIEDTYVPRVFGAIGRAKESGGNGKSSPFRSSSLKSSMVGRIMRIREPDRAGRTPSGGDLLLEAWRTQLVERLGGLRGVASALRYLHDDCNVVYRDVKPDNIGFQRVPHVRCHCGRRRRPHQPSSLLGIKMDNGGGGICTCYDEVPKLFDFGLAKELKPRYRKIHPHHMDGRGDMDTYKLTAKSGSRRYMAPEVAFATPYNNRADVYSFGIMLYQVASLVTPFEGYSLYRHEDEILNCGERPDLKIPAARKALSKAKSIGGGGGSCPYAEWLTDPDGKKRAKVLSKLTKCVWTKDLRRLIGECWEDDMRLRPSMGDVERRLGGCIRELTAMAIPREGAQSTDGTAATTTVTTSQSPKNGSGPRAQPRMTSVSIPARRSLTTAAPPEGGGPTNNGGAEVDSASLFGLRRSLAAPPLGGGCADVVDGGRTSDASLSLLGLRSKPRSIRRSLGPTEPCPNSEGESNLGGGQGLIPQ